MVAGEASSEARSPRLIAARGLSIFEAHRQRRASFLPIRTADRPNEVRPKGIRVESGNDRNHRIYPGTRAGSVRADRADPLAISSFIKPKIASNGRPPSSSQRFHLRRSRQSGCSPASATRRRRSPNPRRLASNLTAEAQGLNPDQPVNSVRRAGAQVGDRPRSIGVLGLAVIREEARIDGHVNPGSTVQCIVAGAADETLSPPLRPIRVSAPAPPSSRFAALSPRSVSPKRLPVRF